MPLLIGILKNWLVAAIGAPLIFAVLLFLFVRDVRRIRRGEPIATLYRPDRVHRDDPWWSHAVIIYMSPYIALFGAIVMAVGAIAILLIFHPAH